MVRAGRLLVADVRRRDGLALLEVMVALVILGLVVVGYLQVFGASIRLAENTRTWSQAVTYAEGGMELAKLDLEAAMRRGRERLEGGFQRWALARPAGEGLELVTVTVALPEGGQFTLNRLIESP
ncbi:MAG: prepilin-type N-terminal cleavage/methylation domain-containing protein [Gemmatimonadota bacterium]|nr:MAG: prepilin-type N-terminal cleavage/methylation domain-containing protein [Gemmatimonadota bacterium]